MNQIAIARETNLSQQQPPIFLPPYTLNLLEHSNILLDPSNILYFILSNIDLRTALDQYFIIKYTVLYLYVFPEIKNVSFNIVIGG